MNVTQHIDLTDHHHHQALNHHDHQHCCCMSTYATIFSLVVVLLYFLKKYMQGPLYDTSKHNLKGKYAIVTGGNSGIGKQTVLELVRLNCNVIIGARDRKRAVQVVKMAQKIIATKQSQQTQKEKSQIIVEQYYLDLGSKKSIEEFAQTVRLSFPKIDYLVNNAGVSLIPEKTQTTEGFEIMYGVNHLGHFYLTSLLMDLLKKSQFFRIINVSSMAHKKLLGFGPSFSIDWSNINFTKQNSYDHNLAYSQSKLCNVLFTKALAKRIPSSKGLSAALHPGVVQSQIMRHQPTLRKVVRLLFPIFWLFTKNSWQGVQTTLFALLDPSVESGEYYADCKKDKVSEFALVQENVDKLWEVSQNDLGVRVQW